MSERRIPVYATSNELHAATGFDHRSHIDGFDIFTIESLEPSSVKCMPPYRQGFYQVGILKNIGAQSKINLNTDSITLQDSPLWFVVPGQVFSWIRDVKNKGHHIQFQLEFLPEYLQKNLIKEFPFFKLSENSVFLMTDEERISLEIDMERMLTIYNTEHPYQEKMLQAMLVAMLYNCKAIFERYKTKEGNLSRGQILVKQFQQLVDKMYLGTRVVSNYAIALNVTPNYLTTIVKEVSGKTAKEIIHERIFLESKNLLLYSEYNISEISYRLNFQEPTHFTRFFKKYTNETPKQYREKHM
ncbi:Transcriptional regulator, AraC family [Tenacibaculum litopenaei]|uniref:helix-turn-helix domain-containing protein n=1 Tax=Tenacibaculum litopenaei TaxID=396016 RepID=UPI003895B2F9